MTETNDIFELSDEDYLKFTRFFSSRYGMVFGIDKKLYVENRIKKIINLYQFTDYETFYNHILILPENHEILEQIVDKLCINESSFFRYPLYMDVLINEILPEIIRCNPDINEKINIWHIGIALGQEAYSSSIAIMDNINVLHNRKIFILGTDISKNNVEHSSKGVFSDEHIKRSVTNWRPGILEKYFQKFNDEYYIDSEVRRIVHFKQHNILMDPYPKNQDIIFLCNVLIYFEHKIKEKIIFNVVKSIKNGGYLFLGHAEHIEGKAKDYVKPIFSENCVYYKKIAEIENGD